MAERDYLKTEAVFLTEKTPKKEVVVTPPLREDSLKVTENGTYQAPIGRGYTDVEVNVQELPEVTSADNGKVLKVEDGEWGKGDNIPTFTLQEYDDKLCVIFDDVDYFETGKEQPFYIKKMSGGTYLNDKVMCIPCVGNAIRTVTLIKNYNIGYLFPISVGDKTYAFRGNDSSSYVDPSNQNNWVAHYMTYGVGGTTPNDIFVHGGNDTTGNWKTPQSWWDDANIKNLALVTDMTEVESTLNQAISGMKLLAGASLETTVSKYMTLPAAYQFAMAALISQWNTSLTENKKPVYIALNSGTFVVTDVRYTAPLNESFATAIYKEIDFTNNYIYDMNITFNSQKLFFQCTCHEATSLS